MYLHYEKDVVFFILVPFPRRQRNNAKWQPTGLLLMAITKECLVQTR